MKERVDCCIGHVEQEENFEVEGLLSRIDLEET